MNTKQTMLVIMGLGADQKPRAATFAIEDVETAAKAANHMGLKLAKAETPEALTLAKQLPEGKLFASGKGLLPLVRREVYDKLVKLVTPVDAKAAVPAAKPAEPPATPAVTAEPGFKSAWHAIEVGATVLWRASKDEGWFEAVVVTISKDRKVLTMRWRDYPKLPNFNVKRFDVGIICKIQ